VRVLLYGEWVEQHVLAPAPHQQHVFTVPRLLHPMLGRHRAWLGELCRIAARLLVAAYPEAVPESRSGLILFVQTFRDLANFNPYVHVLAYRRGVPARWLVDAAVASCVVVARDSPKMTPSAGSAWFAEQPEMRCSGSVSAAQRGSLLSLATRASFQSTAPCNHPR